MKKLETCSLTAQQANLMRQCLQTVVRQSQFGQPCEMTDGDRQ